MAVLYCNCMEIEERNHLLSLPLTEVPFVLFDLESTGLEPGKGDRVCEIALLRWQGNVQHATFQTLINPQRSISPAAFAVNHIDAYSLLRAPSFAAVADTVLEHFKGAVLVAHNAPFDLAFLNMEFEKLRKPRLSNPIVDTLQLARTFLVHRRYSLQALSHALDIEQPSHRAMSDVVALKGVFVHLLDRLHMLGITTLDDLLRAQRGLLPGEPEPPAPPLVLTALREGRRLHITYHTGGAEAVSRTILPFELQYVRGQSRLIAFCYLRNAQRTFYLHRMSEVTLDDG
jgi:DNA polymerase-3 subunit epsilon